jgi:hypothetical protein
VSITLNELPPSPLLQDSNEEAVIPIQQNLDEVEAEIVLINEPNLFCETKEDGQSEFVTWTTKIWETTVIHDGAACAACLILNSI